MGKNKRKSSGATLKNASPFEAYLKNLDEKEKNDIKLFFDELNIHVLLSKKETAKIRKDFENAALYYVSSGITLKEALTRLDVSNLGGFYARPPIAWYPLDDAAKIYPLSMKHGQMAVFRISVYLKAPVIPQLLQIALTFTIKRFPNYATTVKKGFFWNYLDSTKRRFGIEPEDNLPCRPLKVSRSGSQSFRVVYYNNRISVEFFHVLTDGTGGMIFIKTLTAEYLRLLGANIPICDDIADINAAPTASETANEFLKAEKSEGKSGFVDKLAVQMSGKLAKTAPCRIIHLKMDAPRLKEAAQRYNATVTAYMLALMFIAAKYATDEPSGELSIQVPVNMRKFYPSDTLRNFSMYCGIRLSLDEIDKIEFIADKIASQLSLKASKQCMSEMMYSAKQMVNWLRYVPLFLKAPVAKIIYGFLGDKIFSSTLSNLGVVKIPSEMAQYIDYMDCSLGAALTNRASCSMITVNNISVLSISKMTLDPSFEEKLYDLLLKDGIAPVVEGTPIYEH